MSGCLLVDPPCLSAFGCLPGFCTIGVEPRLDKGFITLFEDGDFTTYASALYGLYLLSLDFLSFPALAVRCLEDEFGITSFGIFTKPLMLDDSLVLIVENVLFEIEFFLSTACISSIATRLSRCCFRLLKVA